MMTPAFVPVWMQNLVMVNPTTYGIEARGLVLRGMNPNQVIPSIAALGTIAALSMVAATLIVRSRVV